MLSHFPLKFICPNNCTAPEDRPEVWKPLLSPVFEVKVPFHPIEAGNGIAGDENSQVIGLFDDVSSRVRQQDCEGFNARLLLALAASLVIKGWSTLGLLQLE